jgi:peptide/nickel transport system substrate-binding protein
MKRRVITTILCMAMFITQLTGCSGSKLIENTGETSEAPKTTSSEVTKETSETNENETNSETKTGDVKTGYYNLADFEAQTGKKLEKFNEAPSLVAKVEKGELPQVKERLPENPLVLRTLDKIGVYGGTLRFNSINIDQDWHLRHINAANLFEMPADSAWDTVSTVFGAPKQPGILEKFGMNSEGTVFSATIRKGLKWSDGVPVTTDDVSFKINDILLNKELSPVPSTWLTWGDGKTEVKIIDKYSFEIKFAKPYGAFIESELSLWPGTFQRLLIPKHFMEKYHKSYNSEDKILEFMKEDKYSSIKEWAEFFNKKLGLFGCDNTKMDNGKIVPTLNPWMIVEDLGKGNYRLERNPYYYMVDQEGNQLPYINELKRTYVADEEMDNMATISGQVDLSCMTLSVENYPLYKKHEADGNYNALPLSAWQDQIFVMGFNTNAGVKPPTLSSIKQNKNSKQANDSSYDPGLTKVYGDVRFRRAMSMSLDRNTMNKTLFLGLGRPAQVAPRPGTPFYKEGMEEAYAEYAPDKAKALLDEMGMKDIDGDRWRERPDGKPFKMKFEYFVITGASTPGAELCKRYFEEVGVRVEVKLVDVQYWWESLQPNNLNEATTWWLAGSGANLLQDWFLGPSMLDPLWGWYTRYKGKVSDEDWEKILKNVPEWQREMQDLRIQLKSEPDEQKRYEIGTKMWQLQADWLPIIGVATDTKSPMILSKDLGNVEMAVDKNYNYITVMEQSEQMFFKNPERLK